MMKKATESEIAAAIAAALHLYLDGEVHDRESGVITIRRSSGSQWNSPAFGFRRTPRK